MLILLTKDMLNDSPMVYRLTNLSNSLTHNATVYSYYDNTLRIITLTPNDYYLYEPNNIIGYSSISEECKRIISSMISNVDVIEIYEKPITPDDNDNTNPVMGIYFIYEIFFDFDDLIYFIQSSPRVKKYTYTQWIQLNQRSI